MPTDRCWVLADHQGQPAVGDDGIWHFRTDTAAGEASTDYAEFEPGVYTPAQLTRPCVDIHPPHHQQGTAVISRVGAAIDGAIDSRLATHKQVIAGQRDLLHAQRDTIGGLMVALHGDLKPLADVLGVHVDELDRRMQALTQEVPT